ncbi:hypothetical protein CI109_101778 [Kwoniella shandongensis]|uniref:Uncharacterized protein n=1 Tax=Kwoniella shandongensis TaxID=1734106 RepID=A0A5M6C6D8_9TREE|nr:uncharacterized protein CI109_001100 [Kwoniella shandongensis]KAA5530300.1 hypothetical protein CI109_001100 [Kwoniella shandongensis]
MSDYQARKARLLELQREKEEELKRELAAKAAREKQQAKEEDERRKRLEAASKEARRLELMRANEELNKKAANGHGKGNGSSKAVDMEYDPFAEDAKPVGPPIVHKPNTTKPSLKSTHSNGTSRPSSAVPRSSNNKPAISRSSSGLITKDKASPPPLGRKEKAARAFAQQAKKSAGDSLFSVRALVEARESPGAAIPLHRASSNGTAAGPSRSTAPSSVTVHGIGMANGLKRAAPLQSGSGGKGKGSVRDQIQRKGAEEGLRKLCPDRSTRDRRTIEEIARDIKAKKDGLTSTSVRGVDERRISPVKGGRPVTATNGGGGAKPIPGSSGMNRAPLSRRDDPRIPPSSARKRRPSTSSTSSTSSSSTSPPPPKKRYDSRRSPPLRLTEKSSAAAVSAEIQALFRRPGRPPPRTSGYDDLSDGSSDMEAALSDVELEERRAARIARKEDEAAEREERERKARKEALKKQKMRG